MTLLFSPITIGGLEVRNRAWLAPMCQYSCTGAPGVVTDWHLAHLGARAAGGFGLILTEASAVLPEGRISALDAGLWNDEQAHAWARVVDFVHSQGAAIGVQLAHAGRKASTYPALPGEPSGSVPHGEGGWDTAGPSAVPFEGLRAPHEMAATEISAAVSAFAAAAVRAGEAGFDAVELHAAHGYLLHEFLSPLSNKRGDAYGGDLAGRSRFLLEVVDAVREVSRGALFVRISATDWLGGGWSVEESRELAGVLAARGVDLVDVSSGGNAPAEIPLGPGYQVPLARRVREAGLPVGAVGLITEPEQAESILANGEADVVLLGRAALRDPSWPLRAGHALALARADLPYPPQYHRGAWRDRA